MSSRPSWSLTGAIGAVFPERRIYIRTEGKTRYLSIQPASQIGGMLVVAALGTGQGIFPHVAFFSGIVYAAMDIDIKMFTPLFAVSRVSGWSARVLESRKKNRLFRPKGIYIGPRPGKSKPLNRR